MDLLHTHQDALSSLYKAHTALAQMMTQVDDLVLKAHKISSGGRQIHGLDVVGFSEFLSDMASSLQEWVPQLEKAMLRTEESIVDEHVKKYTDLMSPSLKDKGGGQKITENVEKNLDDMKPFNTETDACLVEEEKEEDEDNVQEQEDWTLSNSPLVPYLDRMQFFILTPMAKYKKALSEPSRKVFAKAMGSIPYVTAELSQKKCEESMKVMPPIFTSTKDKKNISKDLESSSIHDVKKDLPRSSVKCNSNFLEDDDLHSDLSSMLLLTPQIRAPLYRQLSADSTISDSPLHLCEEFCERESSVEMLPITPENAKHQACVVENANTPLPPQSLVKRYSNAFLLGNDIVDSSYKQVSADSTGTIMSSSMQDSVFSLCKSFEENAVETLAMAAFATPTNANQRNYRVKNGTPFPHRSLTKRYSNLFGYGEKTADSICGETPIPMEATVSSPIPDSILHLGKALENKTSEAPVAATPIHVTHQESMSDNATPLPPQSLVKRYSNFFGSNDTLEDSSPNFLCSSIVNENENSVRQSVVLKDEKENKEEEKHTVLSPLEQCLQLRTSDTMDVATPLPPQSLMKRYSRFLCEDEDSSDSAIPLTPMLAISPPKTCVLMRPNQINATLNLKQRLSNDNSVLMTLKSPFRTPAPVGEKAMDHAFYEDMDLTNLKKPNQHLQRPLETARGITPSSDMQVLTIKKPHPIKRTPLVELQFSTMKKAGVPLPGEQTLKRELWSRMEAEFCNMENVCKSLFTDTLPPPPPQDATIGRSNVENRNPNSSKVNTITIKPTLGRRFVARRPQRRQVSINKRE